MNKRYYPISIITIILLALAFGGYVWPESAQFIPKRVLLENKGGAVVFDHLVHTNLGYECDACHHEASPPFDVIQPCGACHGTEESTLSRMEAFHLSCMGCHEEAGQGPYVKEQCKQCHTG